MSFLMQETDREEAAVALLIACVNYGQACFGRDLKNPLVPTH